MSFHLLTLLLLAALAAPAPAVAQSDEADRVKEAVAVFEEILAAPDGGVPRSVLEKAEAIVVFPGTLRGGFIFGAHRGRGIISVRDVEGGGTWSPPAFLTLTGGSFGAQIGGQAVDLVLIVMNRRGLEQLVRNEFKVGADASVAAGPVGRDAQAATDIQMRAQILSYSRARGLFAGVTLQGSTIRQDQRANQRFYGRQLQTREILFDGLAPEPPETVGPWLAVLAKHTE